MALLSAAALAALGKTFLVDLDDNPPQKLEKEIKDANKFRGSYFNKVESSR